MATKIAILSSFYNYMAKTGKRADNPMVAIAHRPKVDKQRSVKWLDSDEQRTLLETESDDANESRNKAIIWLLLHGLRLGEVVGLDVEDYRRGDLRFDGKGGKSRTVPLLLAAQNALAAYLERRKTGPMFRVNRHRISQRQVQRIVNEATTRTGRRMNAHALRHSFATRHVKAGTGIPQLQKLLGHSALSSTNLYIHLDTDDVRAAMDNDPLNEKKPLEVIEGGKVKVVA